MTPEIYQLLECCRDYLERGDYRMRNEDLLHALNIALIDARRRGQDARPHPQSSR